jgi:ABC-type multidrug transport system fused ATPase/permease subunit
VLTLPDTTPVTADVRTPGGFLRSLARRQWRTLVAGICFGVTWMLAQALVPWVVGTTIDRGVATHDRAALARWCAVLLGLGLTQTAAGVLRHRMAVYNWLQASIRTQQLLGHRVADAPAAVGARTTTGEVVSTVAADAPRIGELFDVTARFAGAVVAYAVVALLLLRLDVALGLLVLLGVPILTTSLGLLVRPLQARQRAQRDAEGRLTALGADTVAGLRVLRGIGGERQFVARYRERSGQVRAAGVHVAPVQASLDSAQVLLPGGFVVLLTWFGAHAALDGRISPGQLVTLYGYAAFLVMPLSTATEMLHRSVRAVVAARHVVGVLQARAAHEEAPAGTYPLPPEGSVLIDPASGLRLEPGLLTALVAPVPDEAAALACRFGRLEADLPAGVPAAPAGAAPLIGGVGVDTLDLEELRGRILVAEAEPRLFTGTLRGEIDPYGLRTDAEVLAALQVADAGDVLDALPEGLDAPVEERGRSLSGGQRQRVALARAVLADPDVLVLIEPTSAVDAHTEARIAQRLGRARAGRTTLVTTASPLLLDRADRVAFLVEGLVIAEGSHRELLHAVPAYRDTVVRGEDP